MPNRPSETILFRSLLYTCMILKFYINTGLPFAVPVLRRVLKGDSK